MKITKVFVSFLIGISLCVFMPTASAMISSSSMAIGNLRCLDLFSKAQEELGGHNAVNHDSYEWYLIPVASASPAELIIHRGYTSSGLSTLFESPKVLSIWVYDPNLFILQIINQASPEWLSRISTPEGAHIGMSLDEIEALYGSPDSIEKSANRWTGEVVTYRYKSSDSEEEMEIMAKESNQIVCSMMVNIKINR